MSKVNRREPKRARSSEARYTFFQFDRDFPDDDACLEFLMAYLYPDGVFCSKCQKITKHYRDSGRPSFACEFCGRHEHPMKGTIFEDSATSLKLWFHAIYLMSQTRCGISAKQIERQLGVTYKTAWRMANRIRTLLNQDDTLLGGTVEADETYLGPNPRWARRKVHKVGRNPDKPKTPVFGMAERARNGRPGRVVARVVANASSAELMPHVKERVLPQSTVYTDEWPSYNPVESQGHRHARINHSQGVYVHGDVHTNTIEGFWSLLKRGIGGVYHSVSTKHLQSYLDEYTFRYNHREDNMFSAFLGRIEKIP